MSRLRKTFLIERSRTSLLFRTESAPFLKALLLPLIFGLFLLSLKAPFAATLPFRFSIAGVCLIGFLIMGSHSTVSLDREQKQIRKDSSFYFYRKQKVRPFTSVNGVGLEPDGPSFRIFLSLQPGETILLGTTVNQEEAGIWQKAVQDCIG